MAKNGQFSRRRPWPYDAYVGGVRVMLKPLADGTLVARRSRTLDQSAPTSFEYGSMNPLKERTFLWTELYAGFGETVAPTVRPRKYFYAHKADLSISGKWMKGPLFHAETVHASAGEVRQLVQAFHAGVLTVFAICQNGVWRRVSDGTWTASLTIGLGGTALPAGQFCQQAVRFKGRYATNRDALYVATATGNIWEYDGTTWTQPVAAQGPGDGVTPGQCRYIERVGNELWVAGDFWVSKCEADPLLRASWSAVIWIGDQTSIVTWLKQVDNTLVIFKEEGPYTLSAAGLDQELFPYLRLRKSLTNGKNAATWMSQMWVPFGGQTFRLTATGDLTPDGLEQMLDNRSIIKGHMVAGVGHNTWFFYELYYDESGHSYLLKHGTWIDNEAALSAQFVDQHHGSLANWSKRATSTEILSGLHSSINDRLYVGFADGTIEWAVLPAISPNPSIDGNCEFTQEDSYVYLPIHHSNFQADNKMYHAISIFGPWLTNGEWAEVHYRTDTVDELAAWSIVSTDQPRFTVPGQRLEFPSRLTTGESSVTAKAVQFRVKLAKDPSLATSPLSLSPVIDGIVVHEQVRPAISLEYQMTILATSWMPKLNGMTDHRRGVNIRDSVLNAVASSGSKVFIFADGEEQELTIVDYQDSLAPVQKRRDLAYEITVQAIQLKTLSSLTLISGLTYGTLEAYTYGELEDLLS